MSEEITNKTEETVITETPEAIESVEKAAAEAPEVIETAGGEAAEKTETKDVPEEAAPVEAAEVPTETAAAKEAVTEEATTEPAEKVSEDKAPEKATETAATADEPDDDEDEEEEEPEPKPKKEKKVKAAKPKKAKTKKDEKRAKKVVKTNSHDFGFIIILLASVVMFANITLLIFGYSAGMNEQVLLMADAYSDDAGNRFTNCIDHLREYTVAVSDIVRTYDNTPDINDYLRSVIYDSNNRNILSKNGEIRYFFNGTEYNQRGEEILPEKENPNVTAMRNANVLATYGIIYDEAGTKPSLACYCPIPSTKGADGLIMYYSQDAVLDFIKDTNAEKAAKSDILATCWQGQGSGSQIIKRIYDERNDLDKVNDSFTDYVNEVGNNGLPIQEVVNLISSGKSGSIILTIGGSTYVISVKRANDTDRGLYVAALYESQKVYGEGYAIVAEIIIAVGALLAIVLGFIVYYVISRRRLMKKIDDMSMVDPVLQCPTLLSFERSAKEILDSNQKTRFAVVVAHIQHFSYVNEKYGDSTVNAILRHLRDNVSNVLTEGEIYCYISDGDFALLTHYRDEARLQNRITGLFVAAKKRAVNEKIPVDYDLKMQFGVYLVDPSNNIGVEKMVDNALSVCDIAAKTDINQICNFYSENVRSKYMKRAEIESRMESALQNGEFRIFYQPKYNVEKDRIDGSEILVRWYDPVTQNYRSPAEFLPVFEENGFISKLDRQVYYAACETLARRINEGQRIYPISVNVSRVTAIQPDFADYYKKVKRHFNIADKFITLEFTESFAYENYEYLSAVAHDMRSSGFLISIDDFGTGYSTYNVLKSLEIDEIKLDRFFLSNGRAVETDMIIEQSVINVGKDLNMKVTQEGVETISQLNMLKAMGCQVIQGYWFAKPMSGSDYSKFMEDFENKKRLHE